MINYHSTGHKLIVLFSFSNSALHWGLDCAFKGMGMLFCRVLLILCPQCWNMRPPCSCCSCRAWSMAEAREHRAFNALSSDLLLFVLPYCTSIGRTDVVRVENWFSKLNSTCPRWISEFVKCLVEIQGGKLSVEHKVVIMKVLLVAAERREALDRVRRQTCPFCLYTAGLWALLLSLLTLTTHVESYCGHNGIHVLRINNLSNWFHPSFTALTQRKTWFSPK